MAARALRRDLQRFDFRRRLRVGRRVELPFSSAEALVDARDAGGRTGEQRLLQRDEEEVATLRHRTGRRGSGRRQPHGEQRLVGGLLRRGRRKPAPDDLPLAEGVANLMPDVLLEAPDDEPLLAEVFLRVVVRIRDGRRVQHVHQAREAARPAVVRRRREHDERVGPAREQASEAAAQRRSSMRGVPAGASPAAVRDVVRLVDDDDVPVGLLQVGAVLGVLLQGVDRDDRLVVVDEPCIGLNLVRNINYCWLFLSTAVLVGCK